MVFAGNEEKVGFPFWINDVMDGMKFEGGERDKKAKKGDGDDDEMRGSKMRGCVN